MKKIALALSLCFGFAAPSAWAWGDQGHKTVGAIADQLLRDSHAGKEAAALLLPGETLASLSVWADCVKGNYCGPQTPEMVEYTKANPKHNSYHYTNVPFQKDAYRDGEVGTSDIDVVHTLRQAIAVLRGQDDATANPHRFTKRQALALLVHLVGDLHQPLHASDAYLDKSSRYVVPETRAQIDGLNIMNSQGGNLLLLEDKRFWPTRDTEHADEKAEPGKRQGKALHLYWDVTVVEQAMRRAGAASPEDFAQKAIARGPTVANGSGDVAGWPLQWENESLALARQAFSTLTVGDPVQMTGKRGEAYFSWYVTPADGYFDNGAVVADAQLVKAGYRLAAVLQKIWP